VLLLLDGHQSHKSIKAVELARQNHITMLTILPHTSHRLQPLGLTFFSPLKSQYNLQVDRWMLPNPGRSVTDYELCEIFTPAYKHVASLEKATKGFRCAGIVPFEPQVFSDEDFAPATITEIVNSSAPSEFTAMTTNATNLDVAGTPVVVQKKISPSGQTSFSCICK